MNSSRPSPPMSTCSKSPTSPQWSTHRSTTSSPSLLIAIVAVVIVIMLLLPIKVALIAAGTIPITIFIALGAFYALGIELNTVTLACLIVSLGMIVDNSVVIIDNYVEPDFRRHRPQDRGLPLGGGISQSHILGHMRHLHHLLPLPHHAHRHVPRLHERLPQPSR